MKLAITANSSDGLQAEVDRKFGRALFFAIADTENMNVNFVANPARLEAGGAGVMAAQSIAEREVEGVVSGNFGPKAFNGLKSANLKMFSVNGGTIKDVLDDFNSGKLTEIIEPTK